MSIKISTYVSLKPSPLSITPRSPSPVPAGLWLFLRRFAGVYICKSIWWSWFSNRFCLCCGPSSCWADVAWLRAGNTGLCRCPGECVRNRAGNFRSLNFLSTMSCCCSLQISLRLLPRLFFMGLNNPQALINWILPFLCAFLLLLWIQI